MYAATREQREVPMRRLVSITAGLLVLAISGLALADGLDNARSVKSVAGTFSATTVTGSRMGSCTTVDGKTIVSTKATYSGTAIGDLDLSGPIRLDVRSTINTTDGLGVLSGRLRIAASGGNTVAHLDAVYDHGAVAGFASGHTGTPHIALLGNLSVASFTATGGFVNAKIGGGTAGGSAVELGAGTCPPNPSRETSRAHGTVSAISTTSITVGGLTCTIPATLAAKVNPTTVKMGARAEIECSLVNSVNTLLRIKLSHEGDDKD